MSARIRGAVVMLPSESQQRRREIEPETTGSGMHECPGMAAGTTGYIQNPPSRAKSDGPADESHGTVSIGFVTMRIQLEIVFTEPLFEPFGHESVPPSRKSSQCF